MILQYSADIQEIKKPNSKNLIYHCLAGMVIILFSLYYFILESQTYDIYAYRNINFMVEPELFESYKIANNTSDSLYSFHYNLSQKIKHDPRRIEHEYIATFIDSIRTINHFTGSTIITAKILTLPKLLIYLFGMYYLLFYFTKNTYSSLLVSILSIVPRFVFFEEHWGFGPLFSTQPKDLIYSLLPLLFLLFIYHRNNLKSLCILFLTTGIIGNIHPPTAFNITLLLCFPQLFMQKKRKDKISFFMIPIICTLAGLFPFIADSIYKTLVIDNGVLIADFGRLTAFLKGMKFSSSTVSLLQKTHIADAANGYLSLSKILFATIRPFFNLNTLTIFLPFGIYQYLKRFKDQDVRRINKIQIFYLMFFCLLGYVYAIIGFDAGGYLGYFGRSNLFLYMYIFIFLAFAVNKIFESTERFINSATKHRKKVCTFTTFVAYALVTVLITLSIYLPIDFKPNRHFPEYNFAAQIKDVKSFFSDGIQTGLVSKEFTQMAEYTTDSSQFSRENSFVSEHCAEFIILTRKPTYEFPITLSSQDNMFSLYEKTVKWRLPDQFRKWFNDLMFPNYSYEDSLLQYSLDFERYLRKSPAQYALLDLRHRANIKHKSGIIWSNDKYFIYKNIYCDK